VNDVKKHEEGEVLQVVQCPCMNHAEPSDVENPEANMEVEKKKKSYTLGD